MNARVLLVDDHTLVRAGLRALLETLPGVRVVAEAADGEAALALLAGSTVDVVVTDIAMQPMNGLQLAARVRDDHPGVKVVILSMHTGPDYVQQALQAGASAYVVKDAVVEEFELAVRAALHGGCYLSPGVSRPVLEAYAQGRGGADALTPRQREILTLLAAGHSTKEIAYRLELSGKTVETHRAQIMDRLQIRDVPSLVRYAIRVGLISAED